MITERKVSLDSMIMCWIPSIAALELLLMFFDAWITFVQQSESAISVHISPYPLSLEPPSHAPYPTPLGGHKALTWSPCAMQQLPTTHPFYSQMLLKPCCGSQYNIQISNRLSFKMIHHIRLITSILFYWLYHLAPI